MVVRLLLGMHIFLSIGALFGGGAFILGPDGRLIQMPFSHLKDSPFQSFLVPGILLFTTLGIYPLAVGYGLWKRPAWRWPNSINPFKWMHWCWAGALSVGVATIIWITVQMVWVPIGVVHIFYLLYGIGLLAVTLHPGVRRFYSLDQM